MSEEGMDNLGTPDAQAATAAAAAARADRDRRAPRFSWTPAYEETFFRSLCESVQLGLRENSSFKAEAWERAATALQATHGAYPAKSHLINKSDNARKRFRLWRGLREDPDFMYNPVTRIVKATEEAWKAHIEREPLSRALRGRPFEHEDYMEILYPDVIGSGGAPKRIIKPRRKTDGTMVDDSDMPGASIMTIPANAQATMSSPTMQQGAQQLPPTLGDMPAGSGSPTAQQSSQHQQGPSSTLTQPAMSASSSSVLTPPDESAPHHQGARKRRQGPAEPSAVDLGMSPALSEPAATPAAGAASSPHKRRRTSSRGGASGQIRPPSTPSLQANGGFRSSGAQASGAAASNGAAAAATGLEDGTLSGFLQVPLIEELVDAIRNHAPPRWREQALDIFFRDFSAEELDLQVKISENVLSNENKAMVFCKMPDRVRQHWVGKFRELHLLNKAT